MNLTRRLKRRSKSIRGGSYFFPSSTTSNAQQPALSTGNNMNATPQLQNQPVPTSQPPKKPWYKFWGGKKSKRRLNKKRRSSRRK